MEQSEQRNRRPDWWSWGVCLWSAVTLVATLIAVPNVVVTPGGHLGAWNLPVTGALAASAWLAFVMPVRQNVLARVVVVGAVIGATFLLGKNLGDIYAQ